MRASNKSIVIMAIVVLIMQGINRVPGIRAAGGADPAAGCCL